MRWQEWSVPHEASNGVVLRKILETIAVAAGFGSICVWLHVNRIAFDLDKGRRQG